MAVKIRLRRMGKKRQPSYRVVVADGRSPRDGRFIEQIGRYDPLEDPSLVEIDNERALEWLAKGAQPTDAVRKLLEISGAWGRFRASKGDIHTVGAVPPPPPTEKKSAKQKAAEAAAAAAAEAAGPEAVEPEVAAPEVAEEQDATGEAAGPEDVAPKIAAPEATPEAAAAEDEPDAAAEAAVEDEENV
jgi:small subunit ribosomal protein S16